MSKGRYKITFRLPPELDKRASLEAAQQNISVNDYAKSMAIRGMLVGVDDPQYENLIKQLVSALTIIQRLSVKVCELDPLNTDKEAAIQDASANILLPARQDAITKLTDMKIIKD